MEALEQKLNYSFRNRALLQTALTHSSYANEHHCRSNERLEFVGDSVLGMVTAEHLYRAFPDMPEGKMTKLRAELVCEQSLGEVAQRLALGPSLRLGKGEELSGGRERLSILADCVEAVIAALYLDGGMAAARAFIDANVISKLNGESCLQIRDYKTELQELVQQQPGHTLVYELTGESGPDHMKRFEVSVFINGEKAGMGEGRTKKEAEQQAAKSALMTLGG